MEADRKRIIVSREFHASMPGQATTSHQNVTAAHDFGGKINASVY
jgi:hypothetical protein